MDTSNTVVTRLNNTTQLSLNFVLCNVHGAYMLAGGEIKQPRFFASPRIS